MKNRLIILGSKGMLGQMVKSYFSKEKYQVYEFNKKFSERNFVSYINELNCFDDSLIINCIGRIKQKSEDTFNLIWPNTILPLALSRSLKPSHILIHPSTDCVFDGITKNSYDLYDIHTATDIYGFSKSLGETAIKQMSNSLIIRVSIIGPDNNSSKGLLSWFLNCKPKSVLNGYTNHLWNGVTTLEWCKKVHEIINDKIFFKNQMKKGTIQLGTKEIYSKYEMLSIFNKVYKKDFVINSYQTKYINRCLKPTIESKPLEEQLYELSSFKF